MARGNIPLRDNPGIQRFLYPGRLFSRLIFLFAIVPGALAQDRSTESRVFETNGDSRAFLSGRATIGGWECETNEIIAVVEIGSELEEIVSRLPPLFDRTGYADEASVNVSIGPLKPPNAIISIPAGAFRCGSSGMNRDLLHALRHEEAPLIVFHLTGVSSVRFREPALGDRARFEVSTKGELILAGRIQEIDIDAEVVREAPDRFRVTASKSLRMSDFEIDPPKALFGLIRVEEFVTVRFDLVFEADSMQL